MAQTITPTPTPTSGPAAHPPPRGSTTVPAVVVKVVALGIVLGTAAALTPGLLAEERWAFLAVVWGVAAVMVATYATGRAVPAKYLVPGTLLLVLLVVYPVVATARLSTTNFGDGTRTSQEETVEQIVSASFTPVPGSPAYDLSVATSEDGEYAFFLVDPESEDVLLGTAAGLEPVDAADVTVESGFVTAADGYEFLSPTEIDDAGPALAEFTVPTDDGFVQRVGITQALEGSETLRYDEAAETVTDTETGTVYEVGVEGDREYFVGPDGERLSDQSWLAGVGLDNYARIFTDPRIGADFLRIFAWTVVFATVSVASTFLLGLALAVTLNDPRVRGQRLYRSILLLPYAIPGFISLLVWSGFYNSEFGLINEITGLSVDWFGDPTWAKVAVLLTNLWMGFPYMFLVATGALQAIPGDLKEAASIDGAGGFYGFRKITFPLLLVAVAPLLVASFAFNFNNFNAIALLTEGGPFSPDNPTAGGTDILISYTMRVAFGAGGAEIGFAAAISVLLFVITGVIAALQFRATRSLEEVN